MSEQETRKSEKIRRSPLPTSRTIRTKQVVLVIGMAAMIVTGLLLIFGSLLSVTVVARYPFILVRSGYPQLYDVCLMQKYYVHGNKIIFRDTQPISDRDFRLLVDERIMPPRLLIWSEEVINKHPVIVERPLFLIEMHDNFKGGPELSYHFNEKYDTLVFRYWARFVVLGVLTLISLIVLIVGVFLPKHVEDIGERGGESWE